MYRFCSFLTVSALCSIGAVSAATIFNATPANTSTVDNGAGAAPRSSTVTGGSGSLLFSVSGANNYGGAYNSTDNINNLLGVGTSLTASDTVILTSTVSGMTGAITANGIEFGIASATTPFRPAGSLFVGIKAGGNNLAIVGGASPTTAPNFGFTPASLYDGFTVTLTANSSGWSFEFSDVVASRNTIAPVTGAFTGTEFVDLFGDGHFHFFSQKSGGSGNSLISSFSEASIQVIPEPSSFFMLFGGLGTLMLRRRR